MWQETLPQFAPRSTIRAPPFLPFPTFPPPQKGSPLASGVIYPQRFPESISAEAQHQLALASAPARHHYCQCHSASCFYDTGAGSKERAHGSSSAHLLLPSF